jgi:hypothetical protein
VSFPGKSPLENNISSWTAEVRLSQHWILLLFFSDTFFILFIKIILEFFCVVSHLKIEGYAGRYLHRYSRSVVLRRVSRCGGGGGGNLPASLTWGWEGRI